jgi:hypothetical protein
VEATGDHEVKDEMEISLEVEHDPLSEAPEPDDAAALDLRQRRIHRAEQEGTGESNAHERFSDDAGLEGDEIGGDVGQLGHEKRSLTTALTPTLSRRERENAKLP